jgi:multicomponent Na+:H+ antiporter subunit D
LSWVIFIPLTGAVLTFVFRGRTGLIISLAASLGTVGAGFRLAGQIWREGMQQVWAGGWPAPLGVNLQADGLSVIMVLMTGIVGVLISIYAAFFFAAQPQEENEPGLFWPLWLLLWGGLNGVFLSSDIFNIYVLLELVGITAVALTAISGKGPALIAAFRYLIAAMAGSLAYLLGLGFLYGNFGTLDLREISAAMEPGWVSSVAFSLMILGLLLKTALFPLHFWLPPAHSNAPAPVSAILSALVVKGSFYLVLRLWFEVFETNLTFAAGQMLGCLGAAAILWGSFQAMRQRRLKLLVAYSTVGQIGYLFLLFPLLTGTLPDHETAPWMLQAWTGVIYQALSHALAKAALFLAAGVILYSVGTDQINDMDDIAGRLPVTAFTLALAGVSLIGLPPSGGFIAKWLVLKAVIHSGQWWWAPVIVVGGLLTAGYVFLLLQHLFVPAEKELNLRQVPVRMELPALILALGAIAIGFRAQEPLRLLEIGIRFPAGVLEEVIGL